MCAHANVGLFKFLYLFMLKLKIIAFEADYIGSNCEFENPCLNNPCKNNGKCVRSGNEYYCKCSSKNMFVFVEVYFGF